MQPSVDLPKAAGRRFPHLQRLARLLAFLLIAGCAAGAFAQSSSADEYEIRAAMLLNLTKFIEWPSSKLDAAHPHFVVCILGRDPIEMYADSYLHKQTAQGKPVEVVHLDSPRTAGGCHMLYVGTTDRKSLDSVSAGLLKSGVLILSEHPNVERPSQIVGLPSIDQHVCIQIALASAQAAGFTFSSRLLQLATVTH